MVYLTTKEFADNKKCSFKYVQKAVKDGKIVAKKEQDKYNGYKYMIPITELSAEQQVKYYRSKDLPVPAELTPQKQSQILSKDLDYEELTAEQRQEVADWLNILSDWQEFVQRYDGSKTTANKVFVEAYRDKYKYKISVDILYRKQKIYKAGNVANLVDGRGLKRKGKSCIDKNLWQAFLYYYLDQAKHPLKACYDYTRQWAEQEHPELLPLPSYTTFYRHIDTDVPAPVATYARDGIKAYKDTYGFYIRREYEQMESNDYWIADNHTFDVQVGTAGTNKPKRMYLTAFMDARSGLFTGVYVTDNPSSQATLYALRKGIIQYGIPKNIYVDNGREFLTHDVGGLGHRAKKATAEQLEPPPIFKRLGIKMTNAIVKNARAKTIERRFLDVKNRLSRLFDSYTGGNVIEKPERLKNVLKGNIIDEVEFTKIVEDMLNYNFNYQAYNGPVQADKGLKRNEVYTKHLKEKRVANEEDLWLMMLRSTRPQKVGRRGVQITIAGRRIDYCSDKLLYNWQGKKVYVRYDPENLAEVRVYTLDDEYILTAKCADETMLAYGTDKEKVAKAMKEVRKHERIVKESVESHRMVALGAKSALDIILTEIEQNKIKSAAEDTAVLSIKRADEKQYNKLDLDIAVGAEEAVTIDVKRMIANAEKLNREKGLIK